MPVSQGDDAASKTAYEVSITSTGAMTRKDDIRDWELSFYVRATAAEAEAVYDAIHTLLCTCEYDREKDNCRVPFSGMHPVWSELSALDDETGDKTKIR